MIGVRSHLLNRHVLIAHGLIGGVTLALVSATALGVRSAPPLPPLQTHALHLQIEAAPATRYQMLCNIRTYKTADGQYANRYGADNKGAFQDVIQSPNADCQIKKLGGPGPVRVTLTKLGASKSATVIAEGPAGQTNLVIW